MDGRRKAAILAIVQALETLDDVYCGLPVIPAEKDTLAVALALPRDRRRGLEGRR